MKRVNEIMYVRITAMMFVVLYHCYCFYGVWKSPSIYNVSNLPTETVSWASAYTTIAKIVNNFTLPTFFFLSGLLYFKYSNRKREDKNALIIFLKKKFIRLLLPYLVWRLLHYVLPFIPAEAYGHLWFLITLWWMFMIVEPMRFFWDRINRDDIKIGVILLLIVMSSSLHLPHFHHFPVDTIFHYLPFFMCGSLFAEKSFHLQRATIIIFFAGLILFCGTYFCVESWWIYKITIQLSVISVISSSLIIASKFAPPNLDLLTRVDSCSMGIYIVHHIIIVALLCYHSIAVLMTRHYIIAPLCLFIIVFAISWTLVVALKRVKYINFIIG